MPVTAPSLPLVIDRVERARAKHDHVRLRLSGHWQGSREGREDPVSEALLVVQVHGRRHRFAAAPEAAREAAAARTQHAFTASFAIPDWAVPDQPGQAVLWVGDDVVPVPPPGAAPLPAEPPAPSGEAPAREAGAVAQPEAVAQMGTVARPGPVAGEEAAAAAGSESAPGGGGRSGPLSDLLLKETVAALHVELEQRGGELARLRVALAEAREASRRGGDDDLERAHAELRDELRQLMEAVDEQRREFDAALASARTERDEARAERDEARAERDEARAELERVGGEREGLRGELESTRSERDSLRAEADAARGELQSVGAELETSGSELGAVRGELEEVRAELQQARRDRDGAH
ncbi:MAG TPA: hypothetical protein VFN36_00055, partial [Solirubrobacteraceae bacterium]|nr:hypothetical protein [Solirubrobacteraceae bacterium]